MNFFKSSEYSYYKEAYYPFVIFMKSSGKLCALKGGRSLHI